MASFEKRLRALEQAFRAAGKPCICRVGSRTVFHTAEELAKLIEVRCPAHGFRELGDLRQLPKGLPLHPQDQAFCACAPSPVREFLQGRHGPLTDLELEAERERWEREWGPESAEEFRREQAVIKKLLGRYARDKFNGGGMS